MQHLCFVNFTTHSLFSTSYTFISLPLPLSFQLLIAQYEETIAKIPDVLRRLSAPVRRHLDEAIDPGLTRLSWTSLNIEKFIKRVRAEITECDLLIVRATELIEFRVEAVFREMTQCELCRLPDDEVWTIEQFLDQTEVSVLRLREYNDRLWAREKSVKAEKRDRNAEREKETFRRQRHHQSAVRLTLVWAASWKAVFDMEGRFSFDLWLVHLGTCVNCLGYMQLLVLFLHIQR